MNRALVPIALLLMAILIVVASSTFYTVAESQQAIITEFGEPKGGVIADPGLHLKVPFVQKVNYFEKRILEWDGDPNEVTTADRRFIHVDAFARWRIVDPLLYLRVVGNETAAQTRLDDILDGATRTEIARHDLIELVRSRPGLVQQHPESSSTGEAKEDGEIPMQIEIKFGRRKLAQNILAGVQQATVGLGIEVTDFRFKRINYQDRVRQEVYARMKSERDRIASKYRAEGRGEALTISGNRERELKRIQSEAYRDAQQIRGQADAEAATIYAETYGANAEFYRFWQTMQTYREVLDKETTMVLSTQSELLRYLNGAPAERRKP